MDYVRRSFAAAGSAAFFALAPGTVAGLVPWWLTRWRPGAALAHWLPARLLGILILLAGTAVLVHAFARFVVEGIGTPRKFGNEYATYRRAVPGWWPRPTPWRPSPDEGHR